LIICLLSVALAIAWAIVTGYHELAVLLCTSLAAGLCVAFVWTPPRQRLRALAAPFLALALIGFLSPDTLVSPGARGLNHHAFEDDGVTVIADEASQPSGAVLKFTRALRAEIGPLLGVGGECDVRVYLKQERTGESFGSYSAPLLEGPAVVHPMGAGWGSLAHHLVYAFASCGSQQIPRWAVVGLATSVEKFVADLDAGVIDFAHRHTWREVPPIFVATPQQAQQLLVLQDQNALRSFMVFTRETGRMPKLFGALRVRDANAAMTEVFGSPSRMLEEWRRFDAEWRRTRTPLPAAKVKGAPDL
jgi:hypothetical protein